VQFRWPSKTVHILNSPRSRLAGSAVAPKRPPAEPGLHADGFPFVKRFRRSLPLWIDRVRRSA
jgi:hypothetical protein